MRIVDREKHRRVKGIIANNIKLFMETCDMGTNELAAKIGCHPGQISQWKRGRNLPGLTILKSVADAIPGCTVQDLISGL